MQLWASTPQGPAQLLFTAQEAVFFVAAADFDRARQLISQQLQRYRQLPLRSFGGDAVVACYFGSQRALVAARALLARHGIAALEADVRPVERFLMERFVRGGFELQGDGRHAGPGLRFVDPLIRPGCWRPQLTVLSLDIETAVGRLELFSIGVVMADLRRVFMVGEGSDSDTIRFCKDEKSLLQAFLDCLQQWDPDIIIGWNVISFDLWYLQRICQRYGMAFAIGRGAALVHWQELDQGGHRHMCDVPGRVVLDGIEVIKAAQYRFESYSLQYVASQLLGRGKLIPGSGRGEQIEQLFHRDKPALADYNLQDCSLVWQIFAQHKLLDFCIARSQLTGLALGRVGGSVAAFDYRYLPLLHRQGYVAPMAEARQQGQQSPGGHVLDSRPGIYHNVLVLDFKSLYPSIIRTFCIDPLGMALAPDAPEAEVVEGFKGARFRRSGHLLPGLLTELWQARDAARSEGDGALAQAIKILMNSFYGVLGSPGCRFFDHRLASSITLRGHAIIRESKAYIEQLGYTVIYGDTDSLFVWVQQPTAEQEVQQLGHQLAHELNHWWRQRLRQEMDLDSVLEVQFETHFLRFLMPTIRGTEKGSKKRYAGTIRGAADASDKGFTMVFKGLETVRSDWTSLARRFQQELYRRVFADEPVETFVRDTLAALMAGRHDQELVYRKRLRQPLEAYLRNVPPHAQAARRAVAGGASAEFYGQGRAVEYVITLAGPEVVQQISQPLDYEHYAQRQLAPVADGILFFFGTSFRDIVDGQIALF